MTVDILYNSFIELPVSKYSWLKAVQETRERLNCAPFNPQSPNSEFLKINLAPKFFSLGLPSAS